MEDVRSVCKHFLRTGGSKAEARAAAYIADEMETLDLRVEIQEFPIQAWSFHDASLTLTRPKRQEVTCMPWGYSPSTPGVEGSVVYGGSGYPLDLRGLDTRGKILLVDFPEASDFQYCLLSASLFAPDAKALLFASKLEGAVRVEAASFNGRQAPWPVLGISRGSGRAVRALLRKGEVRARVAVEAETQPGMSQNVIGRLKGRRDRKVLVTAHHDCWWWGANDNATAVGCMLETARAMAGGPAEQSVDFISWGSEEAGYLDYFYFLRGSREFARANREDLRRIVGVVNGEVMGRGDVLVGEGTPETATFLRSVCRDLGMGRGLQGRHHVKVPPGPFSDHWTFAIQGIPSTCWLWLFYPEYHTDHDTVDILNRGKLQWGLRAYALSALRLAVADRLPYSLRDYTSFLLHGRRPPRGLKGMDSPDILVPQHRGLLAYADMARDRWGVGELLAAVKGLHTVASQGLGEGEVLRACRELNSNLLRATGDSAYQEGAHGDLQWLVDLIKIDSALEALKGVTGAEIPSEAKRHLLVDPAPVFWADDFDVQPLIAELEGRRERLSRKLQDRVRDMTHMTEGLSAGLRRT